jgi:hypothetical protein
MLTVLYIIISSILIDYVSADYCPLPDGCNTGSCNCPTFFYFCDTHPNPSGVCTLTRII